MQALQPDQRMHSLDQDFFSNEFHCFSNNRLARLPKPKWLSRSDCLDLVKFGSELFLKRYLPTKCSQSQILKVTVSLSDLPIKITDST